MNWKLLRAAQQALGTVSPELSARWARRLLMRTRETAPRAWEWPALESAERIRLRCGLSALSWRAPDTPDTAPLALMLHGWDGRASQFAALVGPLVAAGWRVVALDGPAHGGSPGREAHPVAFAYALRTAAAELGPVEALVAHSMGAGASAYALSLGLQVRRVVLVGGPSSFRGVLLRFAAQIGLTRRARTRFLEIVGRHTGVPVDDLDIAHLAQRLATPALIVHDRGDPIVPFADARALASAWPGAELLATAHLGHWRVLYEPAVVGRIVGFVTRPQLRAAA